MIIFLLKNEIEQLKREIESNKNKSSVELADKVGFAFLLIWN